jgi:para-aminobenzoate synthetase/4-amino-4-deoxychorismate lyase
MHPWHPIPSQVYKLVERTPGAVLLESARGTDAPSRLFLTPLGILTARDGPGLDALFGRIESSVQNGHFAAGYFGYECGNCFEPSAAMRPLASGTPLAWFGVYARCHVFDHAAGAFRDGVPAELQETASARTPAVANVADVQFGLDESTYAARIEAIHEFIRAGDVYQLNFTFPIRFKSDVSVADLYATLRGRQPVDYGAFLHCSSGRSVLSFSPELFFRIREATLPRRIVTRPMKGTAPRGRTNAEDRAAAQWLRNDAKNRSENVMIVDLLRNDLGRLCAFGSVHLDELFAVERYPSLWQMTSTVSGNLRADVTYRDIFRALFPSGSVTGAPKVRAMQLLAQLEPEPRGIYTGAIGFFSREQTVFNVAIRTIELNGTDGRMGVGSGIVIDSAASEEYRECALKASFLTNAPQPFNLIETMLWDDGYPLIELHLDRLEDSAKYFGFPCDRAAVKAALLCTAEPFEASPHKVRLTLAADGEVHIEHRLLAREESSEPLRVFIASQRTDAANPFLFHKTTNRALYVDGWDAARRAGYVDALFLNHAGQVTEGAASNIFMEQGGHWFTPPLECGVLPGVYRRHLLATRPEIEERILTREDLKAADRVYISNAVGGLRRVVIDWDYAGPAARG